MIIQHDKAEYIRRLARLFRKLAKNELTDQEREELELWAGSSPHRQDVYNRALKAIEILDDGKKMVQVNSKTKYLKLLFLLIVIAIGGYLAGGILFTVLCVCCFLLGIGWKHDNDYL